MNSIANALTVVLLSGICFSCGSALAYKGRTNAMGVSLVKSFEGFSPTFYNDTIGVRKIGYGHSCKTADKCARIAVPINEPAASLLLSQDLRAAETCVTNNVKYAKLNDVQFSALTSFVQSAGCNNLRSSNLLKLLNKGDSKGASREFLKYTTIGVTPVRSLTRRREAEKNLFCSKGGC